MKKNFLWTVLLVLVSLIASSQTMTLTDGEGINCSTVSIDMDATGFPSNVAAISLEIEYNDEVLSYESYISGTLDPATSLFFIINQTDNQLNIQWNSFTGQPIDGTCLTLTFNYYGGSEVLDFDEVNCEISDVNLTPISTTYVNGSVSNYTNDTIYVDGTVASSGDGQSWSAAYKTISEALAEDLKGGDQVLIKPGTYAEQLQVNHKGAVDVPPTTGVVISDTNKINFPSGTDLSCIDLSMYPGKYFAFVFRSSKMNNGWYPVTEVDDVNDFVRVSGAEFYPETGIQGNTDLVMASVGQPVVIKNSSADPENQRVIIDASSLGSISEVLEVGGPAATDISEMILFEGLDITGAASGVNGLHIENSSLITYAGGKIYNSGGPGALVTGTNSLPAEYNLLIENIIYNTPGQAVIVGSDGDTLQNHANYTHLINNEVYNSGTGTLAVFNNAILVKSYNSHGVVQGNIIHDLRMNVVNEGVVSIGAETDSTLITGNILRNMTGLNPGEHYFMKVGNTVTGLKIVNNIIYNETLATDQSYAFRIDGSLHSGSIAGFNTIYQVHKGFVLEDNDTILDFSIRNNIIDLVSSTYFTNFGTSGRYTVDNNIYSTIPSSYGTGNIVADPLFIAPSSSTVNGLRPRYDSPCLGAGVSIPVVDLDYFGEERDGSSPSIGAFEEPILNAVWTGSNGNIWYDTRNWDVEIVPNQYLNAIISAGTNQPFVTEGDASCRTLDVGPGMQVTVSEGGVLTVVE